MGYRRVGQAKPIMLSQTDAAWLAGFIDGEGYVGLTRRTRKWKKSQNGERFYYFRPVISISQAEIEVLSYIKAMLGTGTIIQHIGTPGNPYGGFAIKWDTGIIRWLVPQILPYLFVKKKQALLVLEFLDRMENFRHGVELTDEEFSFRVDLYRRGRVLNQKPYQKKQGIPINIDNVRKFAKTG